MASRLRNQEKGSLISYRGTLHDVSKHLKKRDIEHIAFQFPKISTAQKDNIHDGIQLFEELERIGELSEQKIDRLVEVIGNLQLHEPLRILKEYKADHLTSGILEKVQNDTTASVKVIYAERNFQVKQKDPIGACGGDLELTQNIVEMKQKTGGIAILHQQSRERQLKNVVSPDKTTPLSNEDEVPSSSFNEKDNSFEDEEKTKSNALSTCVEHRNLELNKYCLNCRKRICLECAFLLHKHSCNVIAIDDFAEQVDELTLDFQNEIQTVRENCEALKIETNRKHDKQLRNLDKVEQEIRDDAMKLRDLIDRQERKLLAAVQETKINIETSATDQTNHCSDIMGRLGTIRRDFIPVVSYCKDVAHWEKLKQLQEELNELQCVIDQQYSQLVQTFTGLVYQPIPNEGNFGELKSWHLIGGVIIKPNQIVYIYDNRKNSNGVLLVCFDPRNHKTIFWQYEEHRVGQNHPVVMSRRAMYFREYFHALFACGKTIYIVHFNSDGSSYDSVKYIEMREIESIKDGVWITNLFCHQPSGTPCDDLIFSTNASDKIIEYSLSLKEKRVIQLNGFVSPMNVSSVAYLKNRFAIIERGSEKVLILSIEKENAQLSYLVPVVSLKVYKPIEVISTGARWIVLCINEGVETSWKVLVYKIKTGDMRVCDEGECGNKLIPISVTHCQRSGFLSFSNGYLRSFDF